MSGNSERFREMENACRNAVRGVRGFLSGLYYPDEILDWDPKSRLSSFLSMERDNHRVSFFDFLKTRDDIYARMSDCGNCGLRTVAELDDIIGRLLRDRLDTYGANGALVDYLQRFQKGQIPSRSILDELAGLENLQPVDRRFIDADSGQGQTTFEIISAILPELNDRHRDILKRRYGFDGPVETLGEIGADYEVSRERIRQIENIAIGRLTKKEVTKSLASALVREGMVDRFFANHRIISRSEMKTTRRTLKAWECLAIDIAHGGTEVFLDTHVLRVDAGWGSGKKPGPD